VGKASLPGSIQKQHMFNFLPSRGGWSQSGKISLGRKSPVPKMKQRITRTVRSTDPQIKVASAIRCLLMRPVRCKAGIVPTCPHMCVCVCFETIVSVVQDRVSICCFETTTYLQISNGSNIDYSTVIQYRALCPSPRLPSPFLAFLPPGVLVAPMALSTI